MVPPDFRVLRVRKANLVRPDLLVQQDLSVLSVPRDRSVQLGLLELRALLDRPVPQVLLVLLELPVLQEQQVRLALRVLLERLALLEQLDLKEVLALLVHKEIKVHLE